MQQQHALAAAATTIEKSDVRMALPGEWIESKIDDGFSLKNSHLQQEVCVTVLPTKKLLSETDVLTVIDRLYDLRVKSMQQLAGGAGKATPLKDADASRKNELRFEFRDARQGIRSMTAFHSRPSKIVTVVFIQYPGFPGDPVINSFEVNATKILENIEIKD